MAPTPELQAETASNIRALAEENPTDPYLNLLLAAGRLTGYLRATRQADVGDAFMHLIAVIGPKIEGRD